MTKRALIYDRVSSAPQAEGFSPTTQRESIAKYCQTHGYDVVGEYSDVFTGTTHERPGLEALLDHLDREKVDAVISHDLDRLLGRDELGQVLTKHSILATGARIEYVMGGSHDAQTSDSDLLTGFKALIARSENATRRERSMRGQRGRISAGFPLAGGLGPPFGYRYEAGRKQGAFVIAEDEAQWVREMYRWLNDEGLSTYAIAVRLSDAGIRTQGDKRRTNDLKVAKLAADGVWNPTSVAKILRNAVYKGEYHYGATRRIKRPTMTKPDGSRYRSQYTQVATEPSEWLTIQIPAIVDDATWRRAQERLTENKRFAKPPEQAYLLRGTLICPGCGARLIGAASPKATTTYRCPNSRGEQWRTACPVRFRLPKDAVEQAVWSYVVDELLNPERMLEQVERLRATESGRREKYARDLRSLDTELAGIDRKLGALLDQALEGFPAEIIATKRRELLETRERLTNDRAGIEREQAGLVISPDSAAMLCDMAEQIQDVLPLMTFEERRQLLRMLRVEVDVLDREHVRVRGLVSSAILTTSPGSCSQYPSLLMPFAAVVTTTRSVVL